MSTLTLGALPLPATANIAKLDEPRGLVYGWASVVATADGALVEDHQGDLIEPEELEKAAVDFMLHHRATGEMHAGDTVGQVVESFVSTPDKNVAMLVAGGMDAALAKRTADAMPVGLWIGVKVPPATFAKVKDGTFRMFSIQGTADRVPV